MDLFKQTMRHLLAEVGLWTGKLHLPSAICGLQLFPSDDMLTFEVGKPVGFHMC
jgi:hypothetical protein